MTTISAAGGPVTALVTAPNGTRLAVSDQRSRITAYGVAGDPPGVQWTTGCAEPVVAMALSTDGARLVTAGDAVRAWDAREGTEMGALPLAAAPDGARPDASRRARAVAHDPAGPRVAAGWSDGIVSAWDGQAPLWERAGHKGPVLAVAFGPLPGQLVTAGYDETIRTWDAATGAELDCQARLGYRAIALAASPAGGILAIGCADGSVRLHQPGTHASQDANGKQDLPGPRGPSGGQVSGGRRGTLLAGWADLPVLGCHVHGITAMSFDVSGRWLATASRDGTARVWDLATCSAMAVLIPGPGGWATAVASPEGTWHRMSEPGASGLDDAGGRIWLALGLARQPLPPVPGAVAVLTRSPEGKARRHSARGR
jgi:WD40 repeat protein